MPYSDVDQCELMVGVITRLLPRPELSDAERGQTAAALATALATTPAAAGGRRRPLARRALAERAARADDGLLEGEPGGEA